MTLSQARRKLLGRLRTRKGREKEGLFLVEGLRSVAEALGAGAAMTFAVAAPRVLSLAGGEAVLSRLEEAGVDLHHVTDAELTSLSDTETPQGIVLVCRERPWRLEDLTAGPEGTGGRRLDPKGREPRDRAGNDSAEAPRPGTAAGAAPHLRTSAHAAPLRLVVLDGVQDPGNAGTLVRAAAAFGLTGVVALEGTADLLGPKAVRASAGGVFRVPLLREPWMRLAPWLRERRVPLLLADPAGTDVAVVGAGPRWALVVGSEAAGVRPEVAAACDPMVSVPMPGGSESLNAAMAGSILLYVLTREAELG